MGLLRTVGAFAERDTAAYNFWSDTIGWRARVFHPQIAHSNAIYHAIAAHYAASAPCLNQTTLTPSAPNHPDPSCVPAPAATPPPAGDICGDWYKILFDHFEKKQIKGCGDLTNRNFEQKTGYLNGYQWYASGKLPIGIKACIG